MELTTLFHRIEITFWTAVIPLMKESRQLGRVIQETYNQAIRFYRSPFHTQAVTLALLGLSLGTILGLVAASVLFWLVP